jgi:hypothetical protein
MIRTTIAAAGLSLLLTASAGAWWENPLAGVWGSKGNDTGGIIPWTPENEANAFQIATDQCGRWNKFAVATSISRRPGDYIAYKCVWDRPVVVERHRHHRRVDVIIDK